MAEGRLNDYVCANCLEDVEMVQVDGWWAWQHANTATTCEHVRPIEREGAI